VGRVRGGDVRRTAADTQRIERELGYADPFLVAAEYYYLFVIEGPASIGTVSHQNAREASRAFPDNVFDNVFFCGFTSEASFGAWSYLIVRAPEDGGNVLVDSPRFAAPLVRRIEEMGGVALMYLSHRDDIADHAKFAAHFHCPRVMHQGDGAAGLGIEQVTTGEAPGAYPEGSGRVRGSMGGPCLGLCLQCRRGFQPRLQFGRHVPPK